MENIPQLLYTVRRTRKPSSWRATAPCKIAGMSLADEYQQIVDDQAPNWTELFFELDLPDEPRLDEARLLMAPTQFERVAGTRTRFRFRVSHTRGYGCFGPLAHSCLAKLDAFKMPGTLTLERVLHGVRHNYTQGPV
jgi:hypothetical protein